MARGSLSVSDTGVSFPALHRKGLIELIAFQGWVMVGKQIGKKAPSPNVGAKKRGWAHPGPKGS